MKPEIADEVIPTSLSTEKYRKTNSCDGYPNQIQSGDHNSNLSVSKNMGTPKWMVYNGKPYQNGWCGEENPLFSETSILKRLRKHITTGNHQWNLKITGNIVHHWPTTNSFSISTWHTFKLVSGNWEYQKYHKIPIIWQFFVTLFGMTKNVTLFKALSDLQRLGIKRSRLESPGMLWSSTKRFVFLKKTS